MFEDGDIKKPTVNQQGFNLVGRAVFSGDQVDTETRKEGDDKQDIWTWQPASYYEPVRNRRFDSPEMAATFVG